MVLDNTTWNALRRLVPGAIKQGGPLAQRVGGEDVLATLVSVRHVKRVGGQYARTRTSENAFVLFDILPADGSALTGTQAQIQSDLTTAAFNHALALLERTGEVEVRGKVRLKIRRAPSHDFRARDLTHERDLYPPFRDWLSKRPAEDGRQVWAAHHVIGDGLGQPRKVGKWARPDIVSVIVTMVAEDGPPATDVWTYEIKPHSQLANLAGVYEAVAHQRFSHYSTLVVETPPDANIPSEIVSECRRLGVGLYRLWESEVEPEFEAVRQRPAAAVITEFIGRSLPPEELERYRKLTDNGTIEEAP